MSASRPEPNLPEIESLPIPGSGVSLRFCKISKGTAGWVGSRTSPGYSDDVFCEEDPARRVILEHDLWMAEIPVTQAQYEAVMRSGDHFALRFPVAFNPSYFKKQPHNPVETVNWWHALRFCNRLGGLLGLPPAYSRDSSDDPIEDLRPVAWDRSQLGVRLPTEVEWELACRAGAATEYYGGDGHRNLRRLGWFKENSESRTQPAGEKPANEHGLRDLHGNVWEWCWDAWKDYGKSDAPRQGAELDEGKVRAIRGGSWNVRAARCRSAFRVWGKPWDPDWDRGFRVCLVRSPALIRRAPETSDKTPGGQAVAPSGAGAEAWTTDVLEDERFSRWRKGLA